MLAVPTGKEMGGTHQDSSPTSPCLIAVLLVIGTCIYMSMVPIFQAAQLSQVDFPNDFATYLSQMR